MQSPFGKIKALNEKSPGPALNISVEARASARQEAALVGPAERQIDFGKTRGGEVDGLSALRDRLD
jgi:hypothetical protein